jgi:GT2 family glycosyltransferase
MSGKQYGESLVKPLVSITMVTYNAAQHIPRCVASLVCQDYVSLELIVVDNASSDGSAEMFRDFPFPVRVIRNKENDGFSISQNQAVAEALGEWILCLNPDTRLDPTLISELVRAGSMDPRIGIVCPKILRLEQPTNIEGSRRIDSAGVFMTRDLRHHDRGSQEVDQGQYDRPEYVFGYTGAVVLFRRAMIEDVSVCGEFMDENFCLYREDADLSWRARLLGWECIYNPMAVAWHVRRVFSTNRRSLPAFINMHSTKNRFLMRINNITPGIYAKVFLKATLRDLGVLGYVFLREWSSLPGLWWILRNFPRVLKKRRAIQSRRRVKNHDLRVWFADRPVTLPLEPELLYKWREAHPITDPIQESVNDHFLGTASEVRFQVHLGKGPG